MRGWGAEKHLELAYNFFTYLQTQIFPENTICCLLFTVGNYKQHCVVALLERKTEMLAEWFIKLDGVGYYIEYRATDF